ncbi:MAG: thioredoxin family protein [Pseudomonadota bacterium]|nr:thioredoxin family protein [Pseudomonadota bacterium]
MKQLTILLLLIFGLGGPAFALEKIPFSHERFAELQAQGAIVLVDVYADWCSTCAKQQSALDAWRKANPDKTLHVLEIDFDQDKALVRHFRAPRQSTLLLYRGEEQFWYSVAESRPEVIATELDKAFNFEAKKR